jgi:hypothetical protein
MSGLDALAAALAPSSRLRRRPRARERKLRTPRVKVPRVLERTEQANGLKLLGTLGGKDSYYVLGTHRRKDEFDHGTHQTPGISDVIWFLPRAGGVLFWEAKAKDGKPSPAQVELRERVLACTAADRGVYHCLGTYDDLIAWLMSIGLLKADSVPHYRVPQPREVSST